MNENQISTLGRLHSFYRSGASTLADDFFVPCLAECTRYRRAAGYFSSTAIKSWVGALPRLAANPEIHFDLLVNPIVTKGDLAVLKTLADANERYSHLVSVSDRIIDDILDFEAEPDDVQLRLKLFAWLVANGQLTLKFGYVDEQIEQLEHDPFDEPLYHEKFGIIDFEDGTAAFIGSANETERGHRRNHEFIVVFRSTETSDQGRVEELVDEFELTWRGDADGLKIVELSVEALEKIHEAAPIRRPKTTPPVFPKPSQPLNSSLWPHQEKAIEKFLLAKNGIIEMATGTGKTRTAIEILTRLDSDNTVDGIIIATEGNDLLDQWGDDLLTWSAERPQAYKLYRHYHEHHQLQSFALARGKRLLLASRNALRGILDLIDADARKKMIIVHDEVHGLGSPRHQKELSGEHSSFEFRLGLSATPEREYDQDGNDFLATEIGKTIFRFGLEKAIQQKILCEFDYVPLNYSLTAGDRTRISDVYKKAAAKKKSGTPMTQEQIWIDISKVYKTAEMKPSVFENYLNKNSIIVKSSIIFVETMEYGDLILPMLHEHTTKYRTYYSGEDQQNLVRFSKGEIDCLVTCHRLSQGIDIPHLENVILFSSARSKLETIQRIGRCLRNDPVNPTKRARIIDFVRENNSNGPPDQTSDSERCSWLNELSQTHGVSN
jgi:superfamily II DNA or RNA helicase